MERKFKFSEGEYYHVYNRGVDKRDIFLVGDDSRRFQKLLYVANSTKGVEMRIVKNLPLEKIEIGEKIVAVGAYCLMPNHFHILMKEITQGGISSFMSKLSTGYSMYFNTVNKRSGALFQGAFKAEHVDNDEYLKYLYSYIHLNPVKLIDPTWKELGICDVKKTRTYLENYHSSSYLDYLGVDRDQKLILSKSEFPDYFDKPKDFQEYVDDWLEFIKNGDVNRDSDRSEGSPQ